MTEKNKKIAQIVIGGVAVVVLFKLIMPKTDTSGGANDPTGNGGTAATLPAGSFNALTIANTLYDAMKNMGTNEAKIINALKYVTPAQFALVVKAFGKQSYNKDLGNQYNIIPFTTLPLEPLQVWLENELSEKQYNILSLKYSPLL